MIRVQSLITMCLLNFRYLNFRDDENTKLYICIRMAPHLWRNHNIHTLLQSSEVDVILRRIWVVKWRHIKDYSLENIKPWVYIQLLCVAQSMSNNVKFILTFFPRESLNDYVKTINTTLLTSLSCLEWVESV